MKAVIFDMDGVLVDSELPHYRAFDLAMRETQGFTLSWEAYMRFIGVSNDRMWQILETEYELRGTRADRQAAFERARDAWNTEHGFVAVPGAQALVHGLKARGVTLAVASSSEHALIETTVAGLGLRDCFVRLVSTEHVAHSKPAPDVFLLAAQLIGRDPADCLVVEDSAAGVRAAKAAGMTCIALRNPNSGAQDISPADLILEEFASNTAEILEKWL